MTPPKEDPIEAEVTEYAKKLTHVSPIVRSCMMIAYRLGLSRGIQMMYVEPAAHTNPLYEAAQEVPVETK